ncbi:MAG TPA: hypothetical protein PKH23_02620 [Bacillota bacterium]|nr:hypothetical protein [Bacillota bacterium]
MTRTVPTTGRRNERDAKEIVAALLAMREGAACLKQEMRSDSPETAGRIGVQGVFSERW